MKSLPNDPSFKRRELVIAEFFRTKPVYSEEEDALFNAEMARAREMAGEMAPFTQEDIDNSVPARPIIEELIRRLREP